MDDNVTYFTTMMMMIMVMLMMMMMTTMIKMVFIGARDNKVPPLSTRAESFCRSDQHGCAKHSLEDQVRMMMRCMLMIMIMIMMMRMMLMIMIMIMWMMMNDQHQRGKDKILPAQSHSEWTIQF